MGLSEAIKWSIILAIAAFIYYLNNRKKVERWWRILELGYARMAYNELYVTGAITLKEYLTIMKELEEEHERTNKT